MRSAFPVGDAEASGSQGCVVKITARSGKWGDISWPAVSSFLPTKMSRGREEEAEPCPFWTRAGGTGGTQSEGEVWITASCSLALQSLASCTEELKKGDKLFRKGQAF